MNAHSDTKSGGSIGSSISIAVAILAVSNILSKLLALVRIRVLAQLGGTGADVDAYSFAFLVPELLNHFLAAGMLSITFIPLFQRHLVKGNPEKAWRVFSNLMTVGTAALTIVVVAGMTFTGGIVSLLAGHNIDNPQNPAQLALTIRLTRIILPAQLCFFWGALLMGVQYSQKRFLVPSLAGVVYNVGIILGGALLAPKIGIEGFSWGVLAGALAGNVLVQLAGARLAGLRYRPVFDLRDPDLRQYVLLTLPLILALNVTFSNEFLFRFFGSRVPEGRGAIASLEYSWRIMYMIVGVFGQSLAAGFYPFVSQLIEEGRFTRVHELLRSMLVKIGALLMPVAGIAAVLAPYVVTLLLRVGKFDDRSVAATAGPLSFYVLGTFFFAATPLVNRLCYARRNTLLPLLISTGTVLSCIPLYVALAHSMGASGIALSSSLCMIAQFVIIYLVYSTVYKNQFLFATVKALGVTVGIAAVCTGLCLGVVRFLDGLDIHFSSSLQRSAVVSLAAGVPPMGIALALAHAAKLFDVRVFLRSLLSREAG
jgi:putative peptidoglycan lipid II flippase